MSDISKISVDNFCNTILESNPSIENHITQVDSEIMIEPQIEKFEAPSIEPMDVFTLYGLEASCKERFLNLVSISKGSKVFKNVEFGKDSTINADIIWGKTPFTIKKKEGLYSIIKSQPSFLSDYLFIFHRDDYELISASSSGYRLDYGSEELEILQSFFHDMIKHSPNQRPLHIVFTDQNALFESSSLLEKGSYYIVCAQNFYIPDPTSTKIAQVTIKGRVQRKVRGLKNIYGKYEKYLYASTGSEILEETYPIYSDSVDFTIDRCLFDNLTILDMPMNRRIAIISDAKEDQKIWTIQALWRNTQEEGVYQLDDNGQWFLIKQETPDGGFDFQICNGGKDTSHQVVSGTFRTIARQKQIEKSKTSNISIQPIQPDSQPAPCPTELEDSTCKIKGRGPAQNEPSDMVTIVNKGRRPPNTPVQEFVLTHRLIPFLDSPPKNASKEFVIPIGAPCEYLLANQSPWLEIHLGFKTIHGELLTEDALQIIPKQNTYLCCESSPVSNMMITYSDDLKDHPIILVDQPNLSEHSEAGLRCILDFKHVPQDRMNNTQYHWCRINVDPIRPYPINQFAALIGRGCYKPQRMDLISEGYWDMLREQRYRSKSNQHAEVDRLIDQYGFMNIMSSRYHALFIKEDETLYNLSLSVPIYVFDQTGEEKAVLPPIEKSLVPPHLLQLYQDMSRLEKQQLFNKEDREQLMKITATFLTSNDGFLTSKALFNARSSHQLKSGDSVVIGLSQFTYIKRLGNESRSTYRL